MGVREIGSAQSGLGRFNSSLIGAGGSGDWSGMIGCLVGQQIEFGEKTAAIQTHCAVLLTSGFDLVGGGVICSQA